MSWFSKLSRKLEPFALERLPLYLAIGQSFMLLMGILRVEFLLNVILVPDLVKAGEWWRLATYVFVPNIGGTSILSLVFTVLSIYLIYLYGTVLENTWGAFRFNLYFLTGWLLSTAVAFLTPAFPASNTFVWVSLFLAFATLLPDYEFYVFFVLPVKAKWLAMFLGAMLLWAFLEADFTYRLSILASVGNYLLFFGRTLAWAIAGRGRARGATARKAEAEEPRHRCRVCGKTDLTHPQEDFRYCSKCDGEACYCSEHLRNHDHLPPTAAS